MMNFFMHNLFLIVLALGASLIGKIALVLISGKMGTNTLEDIKTVCSMVMVLILLDQNQNGQETNT